MSHGELVVTTMQKEVALKIFAKPGKKQFGSLSFFSQYYMKPEYLFRIPRTAYSPIPEVDIVAVRFLPREGVKWDENLNNFVRKIFIHKKKNVEKKQLVENVWSIKK